jgi:hypothetical protein
MENEHIPDDLTSELRQGAGREWAEEAAEDEQLTEKLRERQMSLVSVAEQAAHRGDRGTAEFEGKVLSGPVVSTGLDYVTLSISEQEAEIPVTVAVWSFVPGPGGRPPATKSNVRIRARLSEYAANETRLRLELPGGNALMGTIKTVGDDHVRIADADGRDAYVSLEMLRAIIRSTSQH